jgi:hypothetical protein
MVFWRNTLEVALESWLCSYVLLALLTGYFLGSENRNAYEGRFQPEVNILQSFLQNMSGNLD